MQSDNVHKIERILRELDPKVLGLRKRAEIREIVKLELGKANLNYLVTTSERKYVFRVNVHPPDASRRRYEHRVLNGLASLGIAPRAFYVDGSGRSFGEAFSIIEYVEGAPLSTLEPDGVTLSSAKKLAGLVAGIHSLDVKAIGFKPRVRGTAYELWIPHLKRQLRYIRKNRSRRSLDKRFDALLEDSVANLTKVLPKSPSPDVAAPCHGDVGAQNIVARRDGRLRLIDWESFGLWDPVIEICTIFEAFGIRFPVKYQEPFLRVYSGIREDDTLLERIRVVRPFVLLEQLTWAVSYVYSIMNGEMDKEFVASIDVSKDIAYADTYLRTCVEAGIIYASADEVRELRIFPES